MLAKILEKVSKSERSINTNMNDLGSEYKTRAEDLKKRWLLNIMN